MLDDVVFTQDENGDAAVRVVNVNAGATESGKQDIFTTDENGNAAIRVTGSGGGGGGSDQHNLGYYTTLAELQEAHPTATAGDWAIVAESDTVYIWDDAQQAWIDTDRKGQVESVNGQTGAVVLTAADVGAAKSTDIPEIATSVDATSTDAQVVSAKLFYDTCGDIETLINAL